MRRHDGAIPRLSPASPNLNGASPRKRAEARTLGERPDFTASIVMRDEWEWGSVW